MTEKEQISQQIQELKGQLTGELFADLETQQKIYDLKVKLNPEIATRPEVDEDDCLYCGS